MKIIGKCPKCGKDVKVAYDGKMMYFCKCTSCNWKADKQFETKEKAVENFKKD